MLSPQMWSAEGEGMVEPKVLAERDVLAFVDALHIWQGKPQQHEKAKNQCEYKYRGTDLRSPGASHSV